MIDNLAILISHGLILYTLIRAVKIDRVRRWIEFEDADFRDESEPDDEHGKQPR